MSDEELVEFVRRSLNAEEALAHGATQFNGAQWDCPSTGVLGLGPPDHEQYSLGDRDLAEHIATHDPERVLAGCAARQQLLEDALALEAKLERAVTLADLKEHLRRVKLLLAAPYEGGYGWREEYQMTGLGASAAGRIVPGEVVRDG